MDRVTNKRVNKLIALKEIAEAVNQENDMRKMLKLVLNKLLKMTNLTTGWIFLVGQEPIFSFVADKNLPPALRWNEKTAMCVGRCWCLDRLWDGRLHKAVNIISCKRIEDALKYDRGDTEGIVHHASVPIISGGETLGLLNVAAPHKKQFSPSELALLQSIAYQVGTAIKRTRLYHMEQKRAAYYVKLGDFSRTLGSVLESSRIPEEAVQCVTDCFDFPTVALLIKEEHQLNIKARMLNGRMLNEWVPLSEEQFEPLHAVIRDKRSAFFDHISAIQYAAAELTDAFGPFRSLILAPLLLRDNVEGVLWISSPQPYAFDEIDLEISQALAAHTVLVLEVAKLYGQSKELSRMEERTRLARDLHDSVSQTLFSLSLTAKGMEALLKTENEQTLQAMREIQQLAQDAQLEMRSLVWQLRPEGLEDGVSTALKRYAAKLGIALRGEGHTEPQLPAHVAEQLWRIGQEALNNIYKHAGVKEARFTLSAAGEKLTLELADNGSGFPCTRQSSLAGMGLRSMAERAELLGGKLEINSARGKGTTIRVLVPLNKMRGVEVKDEQDQSADR